MLAQDQDDFVQRIEQANRARFQDRPVYRIGDVLQPTVPVVEGIWRVKDKTIVEISEECADPESVLLDEDYEISSPDRTWYVAFVAPGASTSARVRKFAGRLGFQTYWPRKVVLVYQGRGKARKKVPVVEALYPRYLLVHLPKRDTPFWLLANDEAKFNGVASMVAISGQPISVPNTIVERIVERERSGEFNHTVKKRKKVVAKLPEWVAVDNLVEVAAGPFAGQTGLIESVDEANMRLRVAVDIFGRATPVELPISDVCALG